MNDVLKIRRGRPPKAEAIRDDDRRALAEAAFAIVREEGAGALTARGVTSRVGVALGSFYTSFSSLDALRFEVNVVTMGLLGAQLSEEVGRSAGASVEVRLLGLARAYMAFADRERSAWLALFERRESEAPPSFAAHVDALFAIPEAVLREAVSDQGCDLRVLARALWSSVHGMVYLADAGGLGSIGRDDAPAMVETLVRTVVAGLG